ncbi:MAG: hypothetical protein GOVbin556_8 [Prokaryotic dsDNA virus sp.]|nr:MAG: hypothetical protein GOVbin556_8 [Prokaryotic dsDNA virus sp.]|tara:strand:- start:733 stop:921 length:189 start_codon:yes stop_codon:yes gene_type:complete
MLGVIVFMTCFGFSYFIIPLSVWWAKKIEQKNIQELWREKNEMGRIQQIKSSNRNVNADKNN